MKIEKYAVGMVATKKRIEELLDDLPTIYYDGVLDNLIECSALLGQLSVLRATVTEAKEVAENPLIGIYKRDFSNHQWDWLKEPRFLN